MKYILDTDILIYFLKGHETVVKKMAETALSEISTTIISHSELLFGAFNSTRKSDNLEKVQIFLNNITVIPFCEDSSYVFAEQKAYLKKDGNIIADLDLIIASIAIKHKSTLVTNNVKHFDRIKKVKIENWSK